ncbi:unnamed protein product [Lota lota]
MPGPDQPWDFRRSEFLLTASSSSFISAIITAFIIITMIIITTIVITIVIIILTASIVIAILPTPFSACTCSTGFPSSSK